MARPNGHTVEEVIEAIQKSNGLLAAAARDLGVTRETVYRYVRKYPTVAAAANDARETNLDYAEGQLMKAVKAGNVTAIMFLLKTVGKSRGYVDRQEVTGADGGPLSIRLNWGDNGTDNTNDA